MAVKREKDKKRQQHFVQSTASFWYFCVASCNNNAIFAGFSLTCLESLGFFNFNQFNNSPFSLPNYFRTLSSCLGSKNSVTTFVSLSNDFVNIPPWYMYPYTQKISWYGTDLLKCNSLYWGYSPGKGQPRIKYFWGFKYLKARAFRFSFLDSIRGFTPPDHIRCLMDSSCIGKVWDVG